MSSNDSAINKKPLPVNEAWVNVLFYGILLPVTAPVKLWHRILYNLPDKEEA